MGSSHVDLVFPVWQTRYHHGVQRDAGRLGRDYRPLHVRFPDVGGDIGILAGSLVCGGVLFNERVLRIDDPCGAVSVHGYCGWLGGVSVGIFADGTYGAGWNGVAATSYLGHAGKGVTRLIHGDLGQFWCQLMGATLYAAWAFAATFAIFAIVNKVKSMRVPPEWEEEGLDVPEFGIPGYPEDAVVTASY